MAELKKYLDLTTGLPTLVEEVKKADEKVLADAKSYAEGLGSNYDAAGSASTAETNAKAYADAEITAKADAKGSAAAVDAKLTTEVGRAKGEEARIEGKVDATDAKAVKNAEDIAAINHETTGILATAKGYTNTEVAKVQAEVDAHEQYVGTLPEGATATSIVGYIDEKTANIASEGTVTALGERVTQAEKDIDALQADHLVAADKTELEGKITEAKGVADAAKVATETNAAAIAKETEDRTAADEALGGRVGTLEDQIKGLSGAMHFKGVETKLPTDVSTYAEGDVIVVGEKEYVFNGTAFVEFGDVSAEGDRISGLETRATTVEGKVATLEGEMDDVQAAVATKAEAQALADEIKARTDADTALSNRVTDLETMLGEGEGSVADQIEDAKVAAVAEAKSYADTQDATNLAAAKKYADDEIDKVEATVAALTETVGTKATQADLTALAGRVTTAEGEIDTLQTEMDAVEAKAAANESAIATANGEIAKKAAQTDLDGAVARISKNETDISTNAGNIALKADKTALDAAVERLTTAEANIAANTSAVNSFVAITADEVKACFA